MLGFSVFLHASPIDFNTSVVQQPFFLLLGIPSVRPGNTNVKLMINDPSW